MERTVRSSKPDALLVASFLGAIVVANIAVSRFGQVALPFTAFALIPFDLVARDALHERWTGPALRRRMAALIAAGTALTALLSIDAIRIAAASSVAFALASIADVAVYHATRRRTALVRMNASNAAGAVVDSIAFPVVAFWPVIDPALSMAQAMTKFAGGVVWSFVFVVWLKRRKQ